MRKQSLLQPLTNALEDGRIERLARATYPGTWRVINTLIEALAEEGETLFSEPPTDTSPPNYLLGYVLNWVRKEVNGYTAIERLDAWRSALAQSVSDELVSESEEILDSNRELESTSDTFAVGKAILEKMQEHSEKQPDSDNQSSDEAGEHSGEDGDS